MNLKNCFDEFGGNYNEVIGRLVTEDRVKKFLKMFLNDTSFKELDAALQNNDFEAAFRAAHTLKGVCLNLGIEKLRQSASELTEALRGGVNNGADELIEAVRNDYNNTVDIIKQLD